MPATQTTTDETTEQAKARCGGDALRREIREFQAMGQPLTRNEKDLLVRKCEG